ncbi:MAG: alanine racemase, partial [Rhodoglobus sp.]
MMRRALVDLSAIRENVAALRAAVGDVRSMVVVKANAYGHGAVPVARAALEAGADWLGVVDIDEALELRAAGITAPVLCWLHA